MRMLTIVSECTAETRAEFDRMQPLFSGLGLETCQNGTNVETLTEESLEKLEAELEERIERLDNDTGGGVCFGSEDGTTVIMVSDEHLEMMTSVFPEVVKVIRSVEDDYVPDDIDLEQDFRKPEE